MTRLIAEAWNRMWTDIMIETTFMRYGKCPRGLIGITLKPNAMKTWALSLPICCCIHKDIREMTQHEMSTRNRHKEEIMSRMLSDAYDGEKLRNKLGESINPLDSAQHHEEGILNIVSGRISPDSDSDSFIWSYCRPRRPLLRPNLVAVAEATWKKIKFTVYMYVQIIVMIKSIS